MIKAGLDALGKLLFWVQLQKIKASSVAYLWPSTHT